MLQHKISAVCEHLCYLCRCTVIPALLKEPSTYSHSDVKVKVAIKTKGKEKYSIGLDCKFKSSLMFMTLFGFYVKIKLKSMCPKGM